MSRKPNSAAGTPAASKIGCAQGGHTIEKYQTDLIAIACFRPGLVGVIAECFELNDGDTVAFAAAVDEFNRARVEANRARDAMVALVKNGGVK
jgi:hypothetical protein